ncbi:hypothetical protein, partial [Pseudomonas sp. FeS53a]
VLLTALLIPSFALRIGHAQAASRPSEGLLRPETLLGDAASLLQPRTFRTVRPTRQYSLPPPCPQP